MAGRHDDYSDVSHEFSSKLSLNYQPKENLNLMAVYSTGHQTPDLNMMNRFSYTSFEQIRPQISDCPWYPEYSCVYDVSTIQQFNTELTNEQFKNWSFQINYQPVHQLGLKLNLWTVDLNKQISFYSAQGVYDDEINGSGLPADLFCRRTPTGTITHCFTGFANQGSSSLTGFDFMAFYKKDLLNGTLNSQLFYNRILEQEIDSENSNLLGADGFPEHRAQLINSYQLDNWTLTYNINLIGSQANNNRQNLRTPSWVTHDVQLNYNTKWQGQFTFGAKNINEKHPPLTAGNSSFPDYNSDLYNGFGRIVYARYTQTF